MDLTWLSQTPLFQGASGQETREMLACLDARTLTFQKGTQLLHAGDRTRELGLVLAGGVHMEYHDFWGNRSILGQAGPGEIFGETYACLPEEPLLVNVTAVEDTQALFLQVERILKTCPQNCCHHTRLIQNLLAISAGKTLALSQRMLHTAPKTIRGRLLSYLSAQARQKGPCFSIPFDRQQLAAYLGVDRSALSHELSKMQAQGLLSCRKNVFHLHHLA